MTDVTACKCLDYPKLYLSPLLDLYNSEIISFKISNRPTLDIALDPLNEALALVAEHALYRATIHSDQGWHYQHNSWVKALKQHGIFQSMSRKGNCLDNSPMESFFLKRRMEQAGVFKEQTLDEVLEAFNRIECFVHPSFGMTIGEILQKQETLFESLNTKNTADQSVD